MSGNQMANNIAAILFFGWLIWFLWLLICDFWRGK